MWNVISRFRTFRSGPLSYLSVLALLFCLFALSLAITAPNHLFANTAEQEWERVRHNTRITSAPHIGEAKFAAGSFEALNMPYKSIYFPVSGGDDPQCRVNTCAAWDWSNHTYFGSGASGPNAPPSEPPFVRNMSYIPNFVCYDGNWLQWTAATTSAFQDPIPAGHVVVQVRTSPFFFLFYRSPWHECYSSPFFRSYLLMQTWKNTNKNFSFTFPTLLYPIWLTHV